MSAPADRAGTHAETTDAKRSPGSASAQSQRGPLVRSRDVLAVVQAYRDGDLTREQVEARLRAVSFDKPGDAPGEDVAFCPVCGGRDGELVTHAALEAHAAHAAKRALQEHLLRDHGAGDNRDGGVLELLRDR